MDVRDTMDGQDLRWKLFVGVSRNGGFSRLGLGRSWCANLLRHCLSGRSRPSERIASACYSNFRAILAEIFVLR